MKIKSLTGYMLGNPNCAHCVGGAWTEQDSRVWICASLEKAKQILRDSQQKTLEPCCVWTTIYQVSARDIVCEKTHDGLWYTNTPSKICVDRVVYDNPNALKITDAQLMINARKQYGRFAKLMLELQREDVK